MGEVIPFGRAITRAASGPWSAAEVAELNRLAQTILGNGAHSLEVATGFGEAGDPWFVVANTDTGETLLHVARIGGRFVLHHVARGLLAEDPDLRALLRRTNPGASPTASIVQMGPGELALLLFVHTALLAQADAAELPSLSDPQQEAAAAAATLSEGDGTSETLIVSIPVDDLYPQTAAFGGPVVQASAPGPALPTSPPQPQPGRHGQGQMAAEPVADAADPTAGTETGGDVAGPEASGLQVLASGAAVVPFVEADAQAAAAASAAAADEAAAPLTSIAPKAPPGSGAAIDPPDPVRAPVPVPAPLVFRTGEVAFGTASADTFVFEFGDDEDAPPAIVVGFNPLHGDVLVLPGTPPAPAADTVPGAAGPPEQGDEAETGPAIAARESVQTWDIGRFRVADGARWLWIDIERDGDIDVLVVLPESGAERRAVLAALAPEKLIVGVEARQAAKALGIALFTGPDDAPDRPRRPDGDGSGGPPPAAAPFEGAEVAGKRWHRFYADAVQAAIDTQAAVDPGPAPPPNPADPDPLPDLSAPPPVAWAL